MKVKELIEALQTQNPDALVVLGDNSAYNKFTPADDLELNMYWVQCDEIAYTLEKGESAGDDEPCVVIYPFNYGYDFW